MPPRLIRTPPELPKCRIARANLKGDELCSTSYFNNYILTNENQAFIPSISLSLNSKTKIQKILKTSSKFKSKEPKLAAIIRSLTTI